MSKLFVISEKEKHIFFTVKKVFWFELNVFHVVIPQKTTSIKKISYRLVSQDPQTKVVDPRLPETVHTAGAVNWTLRTGNKNN